MLQNTLISEVSNSCPVYLVFLWHMTFFYNGHVVLHKQLCILLLSIFFFLCVNISFSTILSLSRIVKPASMGSY